MMCVLLVKKLRFGLLVVLLGGSYCFASENQDGAEFLGVELRSSDAILVQDTWGNTVYAWQPDTLLLPASLTKLVTANLALQKWGADYRFVTEFWRQGDALLVKGYGDPFLVSEELAVIAARLNQLDLSWVKQISIDASYYRSLQTPGRSVTSDPYNAPIAAVSANFNTVKFRSNGSGWVGGEPQTPLTVMSRSMAERLSPQAAGAQTRVHLQTPQRAQRYFAELLLHLLRSSRTKGDQQDYSKVSIEIDQALDSTNAELVYRHQNQRTLAETLRGSLEFSNNFIANALFLNLSNAEQADFMSAAKTVEPQLRSLLGSGFVMVDGAGLSRDNRFSAKQMVSVLQALAPYKVLLRNYQSGTPSVTIHAKSGTLSDVHSLAGYLDLERGDGGIREYYFVFNFNRPMPHRFRDALVKKLASWLQSHD